MIYTSLVPEDLTALGAAFERKYGVKLRAGAPTRRRCCSARSPKRAPAATKPTPSRPTARSSSTAPEKGLQPLLSPHLDALMPQALRPHGHWVGTRINMFVQSYNTTLVKKEELPKSYAELAHPRWKGRLGIEAEDEDWFAMIVKELGEEPGLAALPRHRARERPVVRKGHTLLAGLVASGEIPLALTTYSHGAEKMKQKRRAGGVVRDRARHRARERHRRRAQAPASARRRALRRLPALARRPGDPQKGGYVPANLRSRTARRSCRSSSSTRR